MIDITKISTNELQAFAARLYTSDMERSLIQAAKEELAKRGETWNGA